MKNWPTNFVSLFSFYSYAEAGLFVALIQRFRMNYYLIFNRQNRIYSTLNEYIDDMTSFDNLSFGNFSMVFAILFSFGLVLLIVFTGNLILARAFPKKQTKRRTRRRRLEIRTNYVN